MSTDQGGENHTRNHCPEKAHISPQIPEETAEAQNRPSVRCQSRRSKQETRRSKGSQVAGSEAGCHSRQSCESGGETRGRETSGGQIQANCA